MLKATNGTLSVATADTDYQRPVTWTNGLTYTTGTASIDYNTTNLKLTSGSLNTIQDISTSSTPTFATLTTNTITSNTSSALTFDSVTGIINLQSGDDIIPLDGNSNLGSSAVRFGTMYIDTVDAYNIAGTLTSGSTSNDSWTINSDNTTDDTEDSYLTFERGTQTPNATMTWDSTGKKIVFNSPVSLTSTIGTATFTAPGNITTSSDMYTGDLYVGYDDADATITTNDTNENLTLDPNGTGIIYFQGSLYNLTSAGTLTIDTLSLLDTNDTNTLSLIYNENDTANRNLSISVSGADRSLSLQGDLTIESTSVINQDLTTDATPTFASVQASSSLKLEDPGAGTNTITMQAPTLASNYTLTLPTTDGNNGEYLQTDGSGNLAWATSTVNQLVKSFTAASGESITAGDVVSLVNGEVQKGLQSNLGSAVTASTKVAYSSYGAKAAKLDDTHFVLIYSLDGESPTTFTEGYAVIGELNGTTITFGTESLFLDYVALYHGLAVTGLDSTHFVISCYNYDIVGITDGDTTITSYNQTYTGLSGIKSIATLDSTHFVETGDGYSHIGVVASDNSISFGNNVTYGSGISQLSIAVLDNYRFIIFSNLSNGTAIIGTVSSGNYISIGNAVSLGVPSGSGYFSISAFDSTYFVIKYIYGQDGYMTVCSTNGICGSTKKFETGNIAYGSVVTQNSTNFAVTYINADTATNYMRQFYRSGLNIYEIGNTATVLGTGYGYDSIVKLSPTELAFSYLDLSGNPTSIAQSSGLPLGIAKTSGSGGDSIDVVLGGVSSDYTNLTVGAAYYFDTSGSLTTTATNYKAGVALSATELLLGSNSFSADQYFNDVVFNNDFRITEATDYAGLIFKNQLGYEILNMNEQGDLNVSNNLSAQNLAILGNTTITGNTSVTGNMTLNNISPDTSLTISLGIDQGDDLVIGNDNTLVVEGDTQYIGVGTSTPTAKLDVTAKDGTNATGLIVNQQDMDQITMQLASSTNATATMFDLATNNTSGNLINLDWDTSTQASGNIIGTNLDFTNLTPTNNSSNYLYGIHLNDPATNNDSNAYAIYIEGTSWDKGLVSDSPIQTNSSFVLQDSTSQTNTISIKAPILASSYTLTLPATVGASGQYLTSDGEGNLTWENPANNQITQKWLLNQHHHLLLSVHLVEIIIMSIICL